MKENEANWLQDSEVQYHVKLINGRWEVSLIFINSKNPNQFIIHNLGDYSTEKLAHIYGNIFKLNASKDARGTQKVNKNAINFHRN